MANKSKDELKSEFLRDYSSAVSFYNENDLIHFNRDIRPAIENFSKLLLFDLIGQRVFRDIENNVSFVQSDGTIRAQNPGIVVSGSGWILNAEYAFKQKPDFSARDNVHTNLRKKITSGMEVLNSQYSETSETSEHTGAVIDSDRMIYQARLCMSEFSALIPSVSEYISADLNQFFADLPKPFEFSGEGISVASTVLEKENALSGLDDLAQGFKRQGCLKFVAILPENASTIIGKNRLSDFFKIKWSLVIDFNPDDSSADTLFSAAPANSTHIITNPNDATDGSELTNWIFAKGRASLGGLNGISLIRSFPSMFKDVLSKMVRSGSTDDYVIVSFCDANEANVLTKAFDKLEDVFDTWESAESRCHIACLSTNPEFYERIVTWGCDMGLTTSIIHADIKDFINHIDWRVPSGNPNEEITKHLVRGKTLDVSDDLNRYKAAGIEFFGPGMAVSTSSEIWDFYSGAEISWEELENDCDAKRDLYRTVENRLIEIIKNNRNNARVFTLMHRPGGGGSTMARRLAYDIYKQDEANLLACSVVQIKSTKSVKNTVDYLSKLSEDTGNACILALVESKNVGISDFDKIVASIAKAKKRVLFLYIKTLSGRRNNTNQIDVAFLDDVLQGDESRFVTKYKAHGLADSAIDTVKAERNNRSLEVIDFPLMLRDDMSSDSLSSYVNGWIELLPENIKDFIGYVGFVSHYSQMGLNQNLVRSTWYDPANGHFTLKGYNDSVRSAIYKLLIEEYSGDEPLGIWRPRYNKFALFLVKAAWGDNWRIRLPEISKNFIQLCSMSGQLGDDDKDMLHSLFIIRRDVDFRAEDVGKKNKFSLLINDLEDPERAASIFNTLVETYPDDAVFHGHFARYLYEKASAPTSNVSANDKLFYDAQEQLDIAFDINPNDADISHMQGMLIRRQMSSLRKEYDRKEDKDEEYINEIDTTVNDWVQEAIVAFDRSIEYDPASPYGYAASCQLLREAIEFGKVLKGSNDYSFCEEDSRFTEYVDQLGDRLDQFEQVCYSFKENALAQITPSLKIYNDVRLFHRDLIGCAASSVSKYREMYSRSTGEMKSIYGDFLVKSILYSKSNTKDYKTAFGYLKEDERKEIEQVLQRKRDEGDLKCYDTLFRLYRYGKKEYPIDSAIDLWRDCESQYLSSNQKGWGYLNACYYLAVCYSALAIHGDELNSELVTKARKYFEEATLQAHVFEKSTINALCYLGEKKDIHCIVEKESQGMLVSGIIYSIDNNKGIMRMKCGLEASFNAKGMDKFKYQGTSIQGIIGFKYSGLGLYQFGETIDDDYSDEEKESIMSQSYVPDYTDEEVKNDAVEETTGGLKIIDKIDLSEMPKKVYSADKTKTLTGIYNKGTDTVTTPDWSYPLKARTKNDADLYDAADVLFELGSEPHQKDPSRKYYFAKNVRLK